MFEVSDVEVANNHQWKISERNAPPGSVWVPVYRRNGLVLDVPKSKSERDKFRARFPYNPVTDKEANKVFVYRPVQIAMYGSMSHGNGEIFKMNDVVSSVYPEDSWQSKLSETPPLKFHEQTRFFCCLPIESMLMWERRGSILNEGEQFIVQDRGVQRYRLLLCDGTVEINEQRKITGPNVIEIKPGDTIYAKTKIYAAEVWV